jgi:HEAT repeat protein
MGDDSSSAGRLLLSSIAKERQQGIVVAVRDHQTCLIRRITDIAGSDPDQETRYIARKALEKLSRLAKPEHSIDAFAAVDLERLLHSEDPAARFAGLKRIVEEKSRTGRFLLLSALSAETVLQLKASMVSAVGSFQNSEDVLVIAPYLKHEDSRIRANAVEALALIASEDAFKCIVAAMPDDDNRVKANVVKALQGMGGSSLFELLKKMSVDESMWMRSSAVYAFSRIRSPKSLLALAQIAQSDPDATIRSRALQVINKEKNAGNPAAILILQKLDHTVGQVSVEEKISAVEEAVEPADNNDIAWLLAHSDPSRRYIALARIADSEFARFSHEFINAFLAEKDSFLLSMMLTIIRERKIPQVFDSVCLLLNHNDDRVRANAVEALAVIDAEKSVEHLLPLLQDKNSRVVANAVMGLNLTGAIDIAAELKKMLLHGRESFKHSVLYVVSQVRQTSVIPILEKLITDHSPRIRDKAYKILQAYVDDMVSGSFPLLKEVEKQIELERNRENFFDNSLDYAFSRFMRMINVGNTNQESLKKRYERNPGSEKQAMLELAEKCRQYMLIDARTQASIESIDAELAYIDKIGDGDLEKNAATASVDEYARKMSEEQLLHIEKKSLIARREALMVFFAYEFYSSRHQLDNKTTSLLASELQKVEASLCSYIPEKRFSMLPHDDSSVSEIFDITMRLYQKHVWKFSAITITRFLRWLLMLGIFAALFLALETVSPLNLIFAAIFAPYLAYRSLGLLVQWKSWLL